MSEEINSEAKTPLEAAIDKATGYVPGDENRVVADAEQDGTGADAEQDGTGEGGGKEADARQDGQQADDAKEKRDWVKEAYECFIKNAVESDPTDPVKAIATYFEKNATDDLKAKVKAEGKTAEGCWKFIEKVARKALGGRSGHVDPVAVYAIAMHYFQDVPALADFEPKLKAAAEKVRGEEVAKGYKENLEKRNAEVRAKAVKKAAKTRKKNAKAKESVEKKTKAKPKPKKGGKEQGFFFDLLETETVGPTGEGGAK